VGQMVTFFDWSRGSLLVIHCLLWNGLANSYVTR